MKLFLRLFLYLTPQLIWAQQNFFNVPSSEITKQGKVFFQQQINLTRESTVYSTTFDTGIGKNWELGVNIYDLTTQSNFRMIKENTEYPFVPFYSVNSQKSFQLGPNWSMALGAQVGVNHVKKNNWGYYGFGNLIYRNSPKGLRVVAGLYSGSDNYIGQGSRGLFPNRNIGLQAGLEKSLIPEKLLVQIEYFSGKHALGQTAIGGAFYLTKNWILSAGYQFPSAQSAAVKGTILELTFNP